MKDDTGEDQRKYATGFTSAKHSTGFASALRPKHSAGTTQRCDTCDKTLFAGDTQRCDLQEG